MIVIGSDDEVTSLGEPHPQTVQVISSDSEVEEYGDDGQKGIDYENSGAHTDDLYNCPDNQGRVLVNIGHPANEENIFLAQSLARSVKPHQVSIINHLCTHSPPTILLSSQLFHYLVSGCFLTVQSIPLF